MKLYKHALLFLAKRMLFLVAVLCTTMIVGCSTDDADEIVNPGDDDDDDDATPTPDKIVYWRLDTSSAKNMTVSINGGAYVMTSTNGDPQINTEKLAAVNNADSVVLTFEYKASHDVIFDMFLSPASAETLLSCGTLDATDTWKTFSFNLKQNIEKHGWGDKNDFFRLDFGKESDVEISVRNIYLRKMTDVEEEEYEKVAAAQENEAALLKTLEPYIKATYPSQIDNVSLNTSTNKVTISGSVASSGDFSICDITPYQDVSAEDDFEYSYEIANGSFSIELDRYIERDGVKYDRALSKWVVVKSEAGEKSIDSHARYTDDIIPVPTGKVIELKGKKGIGGVSAGDISKRGEDLRDLGAHSVTYNITLQTLMSLTKTSDFTEAYTYCGKTYYINPGAVNRINTALKSLNSMDISVAAILLVGVKEADGIYALMRHPRYTSAGNYSMPNMTTPESVNCYAALLNYLASKFSSSTSAGKIDHWIMHNEITAGSLWNNMGSAVNTPFNYYIDTYSKSMRMAYNIIRQYNSESEIFASITKHWVAKRDYSGKDILERLVKYSDIEGDYKWAVGFHCYPEVIEEPRTWNDANATFSFDTQYVTFKNLEVISEWMKQPSHLYRGETKRSLWLSENGTNSPSYSESDLEIHAAGCAYSLKKIIALDGIDAVQWHRWIDNTGFVNILFGLRMLDDDTYNCAKKPAFDVFSAVGTEDESSVIDKYLPIIGVNSWDEIFHDVE